MTLYGGIEAGGTKMVCMVGSGPDDIKSEARFPTTTPEETIGRMIAFFKEATRENPIVSLGIGSFGPVDLNPQSPTYGYITTTPKPHWGNTRLAGALQDALQVPTIMDTDVNAAALAEYTWGNGKNLDPFIYITIGTGIGGGGIINGKLMHGLTHPEMGHVIIPHIPADTFAGNCPYHGDCFEGLACGPAMHKRWNIPAEELPDDHIGWEFEAEYTASALAAIAYIISPHRIVLGGGIMQHPGLLPTIRKKLLQLLNGYIQSPAILEHIDEFIMLPGLGGRSGVLGAIALAKSIVS
jgi:fructokinase